MSLKSWSKKGFTLIELVMVVGISLILFSLLTTMVSHLVMVTKKVSIEEDIASELYFFENYIRDEILNAQKIKQDGSTGFKIVNTERVNKEIVQKTIHFELKNKNIRRVTSGKEGNNPLISKVEVFDVKCTDDYIKIDMEMINGKKREILVAIRNKG
ncbi:MAG: competence type IV pilus minor pilin ComGF [Peptoniphilus sp.]|uniref:competence type IV pilus minor pilin ComGF n=1 Tax=Peptoniphilus sp. TaxID=1971214 RepID=UPI002A75C8B8|nr:competence type IV pilus minor pilin ComGF [Peptoniphilus sp.]MDY2987180.1 competence type IV pilus minor pilin ComGF [Peptoniphilus sp.]